LTSLDILVVDDNQFIRRLLIEILRCFGVGSVRQAPAVDEALWKIEHRTPDIIFCDWMMSPVDGLAFLRSLRAKAGTRHTPVIMITGHATTDHISAALGEGADSYIVKPFNAATVMDHIVKVVMKSADVEYL
jgi:two-component system chemotaxis response regulator CheY